MKSEPFTTCYMDKVDDKRQSPRDAQNAFRERETSPDSAAERALKEAEERRKAREREERGAPPEVGGRKGPDPARYGDWEKDGIVSDF